MAQNKSDTTRATAGLRCKNNAVAGDPDYLCRNHRQQYIAGQTVRTVDAWADGREVRGRTLQPAERVTSTEVEVVGSRHPGQAARSLPLRMTISPEDVERLSTVEGRQELEQTALGYVASLLVDEYAPHRERLKAARMVLPPRMLTAEEMAEERDLDAEIFALMDEVAQEAEARRPSDANVIELLSPETRTRVLTELAEQGIRWIESEEEEAS